MAMFGTETCGQSKAGRRNHYIKTKGGTMNIRLHDVTYDDLEEILFSDEEGRIPEDSEINIEEDLYDTV